MLCKTGINFNIEKQYKEPLPLFLMTKPPFEERKLGEVPVAVKPTTPPISPVETARDGVYHDMIDDAGFYRPENNPSSAEFRLRQPGLNR